MSLSKFVKSADSSSGTEDLEWLSRRRRTKRHLKFHTYSDSSSDNESDALKLVPKRLQVVS